MASAAPEKAGGLLATISAMFGTGNFLAVVITFFVVAVRYVLSFPPPDLILADNAKV